MVGSALFLLFFCFSFMSALGFAAGNRGNGQRGQGVAWPWFGDAASTELETSKARLKEIGKTRSQSVIEAEITGLKQDKFWQGSRIASAPSGGLAQNFCKACRPNRPSLLRPSKLTG